LDLLAGGEQLGFKRLIFRLNPGEFPVEGGYPDFRN